MVLRIIQAIYASDFHGKNAKYGPIRARITPNGDDKQGSSPPRFNCSLQGSLAGANKNISIHSRLASQVTLVMVRTKANPSY